MAVDTFVIRKARRLARIRSTCGGRRRCRRGYGVLLLTFWIEFGFVKQHRELKDEHARQRVVRNGYRPQRTIQTDIGEVIVKAPRASDRAGEIKFHSSILPAYLRRTQSYFNRPGVKVESCSCQTALRSSGRSLRRSLTPASVSSLAFAPRITPRKYTWWKCKQVYRVPSDHHRPSCIVQRHEHSPFFFIRPLCSFSNEKCVTIDGRQRNWRIIRITHFADEVKLVVFRAPSIEKSVLFVKTEKPSQCAAAKANC